MLSNDALFPTTGKTKEEREIETYEAAQEVKKSEFALDQALTVKNWIIPRYIREGLLWLAEKDMPPQPALEADVEVPNA